MLGARLEPWLLITDWPVTDEASALHVLRMDRQCWTVADSFQFTKACLGWEAVRLLDWTGICTLVTLAWVAAGFLYGYVKGWGWHRSARLANACGAILVTKHGCANFMPTLPEVEAFMAAQQPLPSD